MSIDIQTVIQLLTTDAKLDLFQMDVSQITGVTNDSVYFHAGTNQLTQPVIWQGVTYNYIPATATGFDISTEGLLPRPKLIMSNVFSAVTAILETIGGDITGAKVIRRQTYARYLDAANYPARTSLMNWTENVGNWTLTGATAVASASADARGDMKAIDLVETAATSAHQAVINAAPDFTIGTSITAWAEIKFNGTKQARIKFTGSAGVIGQVTFDCTTGAVISANNVNRYIVQKLGDGGWWLVLINSTVPGVGKVNLTVQGASGGSTTYAGNTANSVTVGRTQVSTSQSVPVQLDRRDGMPVLPYQRIDAGYNPCPDADPTRYLPDETFFVERKVAEDEVSVEFELSSAIDLEGLKLPRRVITVGFCSWDDYRGEGCGYTGTAYFDANDNPVTTLAADICSRSVNGCKCRFGAKSPIPFGGFPAARAYQY